MTEMTFDPYITAPFTPFAAFDPFEQQGIAADRQPEIFPVESRQFKLNHVVVSRVKNVNQRQILMLVLTTQTFGTGKVIENYFDLLPKQCKPIHRILGNH
jgi:hypothetical protein